MPLTLKTSSGRTIKIEDTPFAKGGEGGVHRIISPLNSEECVKIYFPKERNLPRQNKIEYMVNNPPPNLQSHNHVICWATESVFKNNYFIGFTMPLAFNGSIQLYELCTPKLKAKLPQTWRTKFDRDNSVGIQSRLKLCTNLSAAIHSIHRLNNYVLVDLKPQNILVTLDGKVSLIDCDSIQISSNGRILFPARVATPEYVPPEGTRINPSKNIVPQSWDRFSMAIMFYEIIFGLHPYAASFNGKFQNSTTLDSKIKDGLFVHGKNKVFISVMPSLHKNYAIIPSSLKSLFDRAFNTGHQMPDVRPSAEEWGKTLYQELKSGKPKYEPAVRIIPKPAIPKPKTPIVNQPSIQTGSPQIPIQQEKGIGAWCLLYGFLPIVGIIMTIVYFFQGKERKGSQTLASWIIGIIILLILFSM